MRDDDHEQDKKITEHCIRIEWLEKNVSTLSQETVRLSQSIAAQTEQIKHLYEATTNTLTSIQQHAAVMAGLTEAGTWLKRIAWGAIGCAIVVLGYFIQKSVGG